VQNEPCAGLSGPCSSRTSLVRGDYVTSIKQNTGFATADRRSFDSTRDEEASSACIEVLKPLGIRLSSPKEVMNVDQKLTAFEVRVLGSLIEKEITTPEYYPLTLNALLNACNQISNRDPVVSFDDKTVARSLEDLREKKLVWMVTGVGRVPKYEHRFAEVLKLAEQELAVLCVLMLRGPQTVGEIRGRTGRLYEFKELEEVELTLQALITAELPLVAKLPRQPGTKESRYAHLLSGEVQIEEREVAPRIEPAVIEVRQENEKIAKLEEELAQVRMDLSELKQQFVDFKKQFE
jgi:uncharacterized protein